MKIIQILICIFGVAGGLFIYLKPAASIEIQRRFYEKINWRLEPISMTKEIKNTKAMGIFLFAVALMILFVSLTNQKVFFK